MSRFLLPLVFLAFLFGSCAPGKKKLRRDYVYFQDSMSQLQPAMFYEPAIQNSDLLSIQVYSGGISQEQAMVFNIPNGGGLASGMTAVSSTAGSTSGYQVDMQGQVEIPLIGKVRAAGLTRAELAKAIENKLTSMGLVKDPLVLVKFNQFRINVLGEVKSPGAKTFNTDRANLIDAIAASGDLSDDGRRDNIMIIREEPSGRHIYEVDIRSGAMFSSPAFQMKQNDIVYVSPRSNKLKNLNVDPNTQRYLQNITAVLSLALSALTITLYATRNN